jgi:hypothetical protein
MKRTKFTETQMVNTLKSMKRESATDIRRELQINKQTFTTGRKYMLVWRAGGLKNQSTWERRIVALNRCMLRAAI